MPSGSYGAISKMAASEIYDFLRKSYLAAQELLLYDLIYQLPLIREHANNIETLIVGIWHSHG